MPELHIKDLGPRQLWKLRKEITLNSIYLEDYSNSLGIDKNEACMFFDAYAEHLEDLMREKIKGYKDSQFYDYLHKYDTCRNLKNFAIYLGW